MIIALKIAGLLIIILLIGRINFSIQYSKMVKELFSASKDISTKVFRYEQLADLPEPVQHYFKHVLKDGQPYISYVRLKHNGQFKTGVDKDWVNITGEQYFSTQKPGFIWKGTTSKFTARDMYLANKGRLIVTLFSLINVVNGKGEQYNQGELLRWLSESVWFPTNLLPNENLQWSPIDKYTAKITFMYNGLSLFYTVTFNDKDEIIKLETKRYMNAKNLETWICKKSNYKEMNNMLVPTATETIWKLVKGDLSYAKFNVTSIKYDKSNYFS